MNNGKKSGINVRYYGAAEQRARQREINNHAHALAAINGESWRDFIFRVLEEKIKKEEEAK